MSDTRIFGTVTVEFNGDTFQIKDSEWQVPLATFCYRHGHLIDPVTDNVFKTTEPWAKLEQMINDTDENGFNTDDFGDYAPGDDPDVDISWEDCEACGDAYRYETNGRCFNHELES